MMTLTQMRHTKLWFAGAAGNWPLAAYEIAELKEGFDEIIAFHPTHDDVSIDELLPQMMADPLEHLDGAIAAKDSVRFIAAFNALTAGCNSCHQAAAFALNVVTRPTTNPYSNQNFATPGTREAAH